MHIKHTSIKASTKKSKTRIYAADDDSFENFSFDDEPSRGGFDDEDDDSLNDTLDGIADDIEDIRDDVNDIQEDDPDIDMDNNIENHYIAECDRCHGVFISAVIESDQLLKWVVKAVE